MVRTKKIMSYCLLITVVIFNLTGCSNSHVKTEIQMITTPISMIAVPEAVKIIGLGEATHGNVEFQQLKKDVFKAVLENNCCRVFAIEGDFGGAYRVNEYISGGEGTARNAVEQLGFAIYRTKEMEQLVQWMHDYNEQTSEDKKIKFYGFDMQRYDNSKVILFQFLEENESPQLQTYEDGLALLNDDTVYDQKKSNIKQAKKCAEALQQELLQNEAKYREGTSEKEYELALECIKAIIENTTLQLSGSDYSTLRDQYMKDRIEWIYNYEGKQKLFITAHDGHIDKSSAVKGYTSMGKLLTEDFGDSYYAIGTDFLKGEVNAVTMSGKRKNFYIHNKNQLTALFENANENEYYLDFSKAENIPEVDMLLNTKQRITSIGAQFDTYQKYVKFFYTLNMVPKNAYDSIIIVKTVTPTEVQQLSE